MVQSGETILYCTTPESEMSVETFLVVMVAIFAGLILEAMSSFFSSSQAQSSRVPANAATTAHRECRRSNSAIYQDKISGSYA